MVQLKIKFHGILWYLVEYFKVYSTVYHRENFLSSTQLSTKFIMLINVKMPTIVDILTFVSMIYTTSESLKPRKIFIFQHLSYKKLKFHSQLS